MKYPLRAISIHDFHLGHDVTPTENIIARAEKYIINDEVLKGVDLLMYAGDIYDQVLLNSDIRVAYINNHFHRVFQYARKYKIVVILLDGTPSHDGGQAKQLEAIAKTLYPDVEFYFIKDMEIKYIGSLDTTMMFVPDEWASREVMYLTAKKLLKEHDLEKVDIILGHNQFGYQFAEGIREKISHLNEEDWCEMVKHHCLFGHVHKRSQYKKIEVAGSFDRLAHGEEQPKGYLDITYLNDDESIVTFVENPEAELYLSIRLQDNFDYKDISSYRELDEQIAKLNRSSGNIRFIYSDKSIDMKNLLAYFKTMYSQYRFTEKYISEDRKYTPVLEVTQHYTQDYVALTRDNILSLILNELDDSENKKPIEQLASHYLAQC